MTTSLDITAISFKLRGLYQKTDEENPGEQEIDMSFLDSLSNGIASDQANQILVKERTIASSTDDNIDLEGGVVDIFGTTLNPASVVGVIIQPSATNAGKITLGNNANSPKLFFGAITHTLDIWPGGFFCNYAPSTAADWITTAATGDIFKINNPNASAVKYKLGLIMRSS